jgi:hypothetical protein
VGRGRVKPMKRRHKDKPYQEGQLVALPKKVGGFVPLLVARKGQTGREGYKLLYVVGFGCIMRDLQDVPSFPPGPIVLRTMVSDVFISEGRWRPLPSTHLFRREDWPLPKFGRLPAGSPVGKLTTYSEDDPSECVSEVDVDIELLADYPVDCVHGPLLLEEVLGELADERSDHRNVAKGGRACC